MGHEFIKRVIKTSAVVAAIISLLVATYISPASGAALLLGAFWSSLNLLAVSSMVQITVGTEKPARLKVLRAVILKFPVLYGSGFLLLKVRIFPVESLVMGFSLVLAVIFLKALGALLVEKSTQKKRPIYA